MFHAEYVGIRSDADCHEGENALDAILSKSRMGAAMSSPNKRKQPTPTSPPTAHTALVTKKQGKKRVVQEDEDADFNEEEGGEKEEDRLERILALSMQRKSLPLGCTLEPVGEKEKQCTWRLTKRALQRNRKRFEANGFVDFVVENPLGKLWGQQYIKRLVDRGVNLQRTSYCRYECGHRKHTNLLSSLNFSLSERCSKKKPCASLNEHGVHREQVQGKSLTDKNAIPQPLVQVVLEYWLRERCTSPVHRALIIDCFAGWGSISKAAQAMERNVYVYTNDIKRLRSHSIASLDLRHVNINALLFLALARAARDDDEQKIVFDNRFTPVVAARLLGWRILFWVSTPCNTYSTASTTVRHRTKSGHALTSDAKQCDEMNMSILAYLEAVCLKYV